MTQVLEQVRRLERNIAAILRSLWIILAAKIPHECWVSSE